jgi:hypothetical protein
MRTMKMVKKGTSTANNTTLNRRPESRVSRYATGYARTTVRNVVAAAMRKERKNESTKGVWNSPLSPTNSSR